MSIVLSKVAEYVNIVLKGCWRCQYCYQRL